MNKAQEENLWRRTSENNWEQKDLDSLKEQELSDSDFDLIMPIMNK